MIILRTKKFSFIDEFEPDTFEFDEFKPDTFEFDEFKPDTFEFDEFKPNDVPRFLKRKKDKAILGIRLKRRNSNRDKDSRTNIIKKWEELKQRGKTSNERVPSPRPRRPITIPGVDESSRRRILESANQEINMRNNIPKNSERFLDRFYKNGKLTKTGKWAAGTAAAATATAYGGYKLYKHYKNKKKEKEEAKISSENNQ
jgi:hypothetical protein